MVYRTQPNFPRCNGACDAAEEHVMRFIRNDMVILRFRAGDRFSIAGHYPLLAEYRGGTPLYCAYYEGNFPGQSGKQRIDIAILNGIRPENIKFVSRLSDGSFVTTVCKDIRVYALRYDPYAYDLCERYSSREKEDVPGIDATGPFSWKFERRLPDIKVRKPISPDEASIRAPRLLWVESLIDWCDEDIL